MKPTPTSPAGLPKYIQHPQRYAARYGNFMLTPRDHEILDLVYRYRHLEARHIRALIPGSNQQITRRLQGLFHNKYLRRYVQQASMRPELTRGPPLTAYGLDSRGAQELVLHRHLRPDGAGDPLAHVRWSKAYTRRTQWFLRHRVALSHFRCVLELAVRAVPGIGVSAWSEGESITARYVTDTERATVRRVVPDAKFSIIDRGRIREFYLEIDRATEEKRRLQHKFSTYWRHLEQTANRRAAINRQRVNVLFVTTTRARMTNIMRTLREMKKPAGARHVGRASFLFSLLEHFDLDDPGSCLGPIWSKVTQSATDSSLR